MSIPAKPTLTTPPVAPVRGQDRTTFANRANDYIAWIGTNVSELSDTIDWQNTVFTETESVANNAINTTATNVQLSEDWATSTTEVSGGFKGSRGYALDAAQSATDAYNSAQVVNFQGVYSAGTTYSTGQAVAYDGLYYVSLVDSNTGNQPDTSPSQWYKVGYTPVTDYQEFTSSGTWNKPEWATQVYVEAYSAGNGGEGGKLHVRLMSSSACNDAESVVVGMADGGSSHFGNLVTGAFDKATSLTLFNGGDGGGLNGYDAVRYDPFSGETVTTPAGEDSTNYFVGGGGGVLMPKFYSNGTYIPSTRHSLPIRFDKIFEYFDGRIFAFVALNSLATEYNTDPFYEYLVELNDFSIKDIIKLPKILYGEPFHCDGKLFSTTTPYDESYVHSVSENISIDIIDNLTDVQTVSITNTASKPIGQLAEVLKFGSDYYFIFGSSRSTNSHGSAIFKSSDLVNFSLVYELSFTSTIGTMCGGGVSNSSAMMINVCKGSDKRSFTHIQYTVLTTDGVNWVEDVHDNHLAGRPIALNDGSFVSSAAYYYSSGGAIWFGWVYAKSPYTYSNSQSYGISLGHDYELMTMMQLDSGEIYGLINSSVGSVSESYYESGIFRLKSDLSTIDYYSRPSKNSTIALNPLKSSSPKFYGYRLTPEHCFYGGFLEDTGSALIFNNVSNLDVSGIPNEKFKFPFFSFGGSGGIAAGKGISAPSKTGDYELRLFDSSSATNLHTDESLNPSTSGDGLVRVWAW